MVKVEIHNGLVEEYNLKDFDVNKLYIDELKDFIDLSANNIIEHPLDANHAIANTKLMLAIHESASLKRQIFFDEQA